MTTSVCVKIPPSPPGLSQLVEKYGRNTPSSPVRFRLPSWEKALASVTGNTTKLLSDSTLTTALSSPGYGERGDRELTREAVMRACASVDMADDESVVAAFVLVMAWGSGTSNSRSLRNTAAALRDVPSAATALRNSALALRDIHKLEDPNLLDIHHGFSLPGVGEAFFTKWFSFAGVVPQRDWQPLILDSRVRATLHKTLDVWLDQMTDIRNDRRRYVAYLSAMHRWATDLSVTATQLEWIMFRHNGKAL